MLKRVDVKHHIYSGTIPTTNFTFLPILYVLHLSSIWMVCTDLFNLLHNFKLYVCVMEEL